MSEPTEQPTSTPAADPSACDPKPEREFVLPPIKPVKGTSPRVAGCGRWAAYGCLFGIVVLVGFLFTSFFTIKKGLLWTAVRGCHQVERKLPSGMDPMERARVMRNFDRLIRELRAMDDPNPVMGRYLGLVVEVLEDDVVTLDEVAELNAFIETEFPALEPTPGPATPPLEAEPPPPTPEMAAESEPAGSD